MAKRNNVGRQGDSMTAAKEFIGEPAKEAPAAEVKDVLQHDEKMAEAVEQHVAEVAEAVLQSAAPAAKSADQLVELAAADLLKREHQRDLAEKASVQAQAARAAAEVKEEALTLKARVMRTADEFIAKAEHRLDALPEPVRKLGKAVERTAGIVLWPARFGLRLAGEVLRTPVAFARILLRSREA